MANQEITQQRLYNQRLSTSDFKKPAEVVEWLGAVQAQDYYGAKWALALRMEGARDADIEKAFTDGTILRTHVMRPTWHFVTPADIRWLLKLTAPRVQGINSHYYRKLELDAALFKRVHKAVTRALRDRNNLTRDELREVVRRAGIETADSTRFGFILIHAELEGLICSGGRKGKQFTYALLDERAPKGNALSHDDALGELTHRYFRSHGPATLQDFVWWSGLITSDARAGLAMNQTQLVKEVIDGKTYWRPSSESVLKPASRVACLLPSFDEYLVAYKDRTTVLASSLSMKAMERNPIFNSVILIGGEVVGGWKRTFRQNTVVVTLSPFVPFTKAEERAITEAAVKYGAFLGIPVMMESGNNRKG